jgi:hypothetical protein
VQISSFKAILDQGFEIYGKKSVPGQTLFRDRIRPDFNKSGYSEEKLNSTAFEIEDYNLLVLLKVLNPSTPNRTILLFSQYIDFIVHYVENKLLNATYKCYKIENAAMVHTLNDLLFFRLGLEAKKMVNYIDTGGISLVWKDWEDFGYKLYLAKKKATRSRMRPLCYIQLHNLTSIFFLCAVVLFWAFIFFIGENVYYWRKHRVKVYGYLE